MIKYSKNDSVEIIQHSIPKFTHQQFNKIIHALETEKALHVKSDRLITGSYVTFTKKDIELIERIYLFFIKEYNISKHNNKIYSYLDATRAILKEDNK